MSNNAAPQSRQPTNPDVRQDAPHVQAAFINAISEEGDKAEAIHYLQKTWNEACALKADNASLKARVEELESRTSLVTFNEACKRIEELEAVVRGLQGAKHDAMMRAQALEEALRDAERGDASEVLARYRAIRRAVLPPSSGGADR